MAGHDPNPQSAVCSFINHDFADLQAGTGSLRPSKDAEFHGIAGSHFAGLQSLLKRSLLRIRIMIRKICKTLKSCISETIRSTELIQNSNYRKFNLV